ncbi:MAG TPA: 2,3-bisphosphoglycerate-independent phosphoglycerate mutase, partial [Paracoccaceae bacterium]|nr:2,3-bisphosphoglycerate-independent phosphoglycerate mutase [Paracoccaceae bacterium]
IAELESNLDEGAKIATVCGRFYAMDRDNRWERVQAAFDVMASAKGNRAENAEAAITSAYEAGETDEFVSPCAIGDYAGMVDGDGLLFMNFRADRAREILAALADPAFDDFDVSARPRFAAVCGIVEYSDKHNKYMDVMYPSEEIVNTLGQWVAKHGKTQYRLAETEKYPHVTFFLNGGVEVPDGGEERYVAPSPKVRTYDMQPEMSAGEVTEHLVDAIKSQAYDLIVVNFANPDMVGHTGDLAAAMVACEAVDSGLGQALAALDQVGGAMIVTADHGNCETMVDPETGGPHTAHTTNPVPVILVNGPKGATLRSGGKLGDLAPSLLQLMGLEQPAEMTGETLIV